MEEIAMDLHISHNAAEWRETTARQAKEKTPQRQPTFETSSHIEIPDLLTEEDQWAKLRLVAEIAKEVWG